MFDYGFSDLRSDIISWGIDEHVQVGKALHKKGEGFVKEATYLGKLILANGPNRIPMSPTDLPSDFGGQTVLLLAGA
jgi:hypothetical protein